jgi:hypothetical protein
VVAGLTRYVLEVFVSGQKQAVVLDGCGRDLAVGRRHTDPFRTTVPVQPGGRNIAAAPRGKERKRLEVSDHPSKGRFPTKRLKNLLQNQAGQKQVFITKEEGFQFVGGRVICGSFFAKREGPHRSVHQYSQRRLLSSL